MTNCETENCENKNHHYLILGCVVVGVGLWFYLKKDDHLICKKEDEAEAESKEEQILSLNHDNHENHENQEVKDLIQKLEQKMEEPKKSKEEELLEEFKKLNLDDLTEEEVLHWHKVLSNLN